MTASLKPTPKTELAMDKLRRFLEERRKAGKPATSFEQFEEELHRVVSEVECEAVGEELERHDIEAPLVEIDGVPHRRVVRCEETYFSPAGPVRVERSLYATRTGAGEHAACPLELRAGIVEGKWTPRAAKQALWFVANLTPGAVEELYQRLGGLMPSKTSLDRLPKKVSGRWEAERERFEAALREKGEISPEAVAVGVSLDGVMVPMKDGERKKKREEAAAAGKHTRGSAGYQEVGCGTLTFYDRTGELLSSVRLGRMPEASKATLKSMLTEELAWVKEQRPDLKVVRLADGAKDNWTFLDALPVEGPSVIDFFHAAEHVSKALDAAYGEGSPKARSQFEKLRHILRHEEAGVEKVIRALLHLRKEHPRSKVLKTELNYFRKGRHKMQYASVAASQLPIGTGVTEAACKTLATQRLKCSGMAWRNEGGQAILSLRSFIQSNRFDAAWELLLKGYMKMVTLPDNVVPLQPRRQC
jgi:hypothetical protein